MLEWVMAVDEKHWGERWLLANKVLPRYDRSRGNLINFLSTCWRRYRIDQYRRESARSVSLAPNTVFDGIPTDGGVNGHHENGVPEGFEELRLLAMGLSYREIATSVGIQVGTVKSRLHRQRSLARTVADKKMFKST